MTDYDHFLPRVDMPHQAGVLGTAWMDTGKRALMLTRLQPSDFVGVDHELALRLWEAGDDYTYLTVESALSDGARKRVAEIQATLEKPDTRDFMLWLETIQKAAMTRAIVGKLQHAVATIKPDTNPHQAITEIVSGLLEVSQRDTGMIKDVKEAADKARQNVADWRAGRKYQDAISTGFGSLDRTMGGMKRGHICTIAARPGRFKTQLALQIARNVAKRIRAEKRQAGVVIFSAEMTDDELFMRIAQCSSNISAAYLEEGEYPDTANGNKLIPVSAEMYDRFEAEIGVVESELQGIVKIDDSSAPPTRYMYQVVAAQAALFPDGIDLVVFDYLELAGDYAKGENETVRLGRIMRGLKRIAKDFRCALINIAQLSKDIDRRHDKWADLVDLSGTKDIEALSNQVLFIDYPDAYHKKSGAAYSGYGNEDLMKRAQSYQERGGNIGLFIAKNRNRRNRTTKVMRVTPETTRIEELSETDSMEAVKQKMR